ncbi:MULTISPECIES: helix-turn-helix transcriptional regulator [Saliphagus]|uniref:Helix-turn-helix transcriptional regulator n=1 Tax=Saliphagus infecundisoli TaxID=1849069 RepID=A0ABD5QG43_9EURY|nr:MULTISPECIES: helix-turn-helix domain-containing protein [Saliphagus]
MSRSAAVALVVAVVVLGACGLVVADGPGQTSSGSDDSAVSESATGPLESDTAVERPATVVAPDEFDTTRFEVVVYENGTVTWTHRHERQLDNQEVEEFKSFAENFEEDEESPLYTRFTEQAGALIGTGSEQTDREMESRNFNRSADVEYRPGPMGVVEMRFTWTNFAEVEDDGTVVVGDVFDGGLYIGESQSLELVAGEDLEFREARPEPEYPGTSLEAASSVTWSGEHEFLDGRPYAVLEDPDEAAAGANEGTEGLLTPVEGSTWLVAGGLLVALGIGAVVALAWYRSSEGAAEERRGTDTPEPSGEPATNGAGTTTAAEGAGAAPGEPDPIPESELMTDEDRVVRLIRENGGRMKQVNIVEETGWSKSKVSMLLSEMEDQGTVSKLRVGRENIVSLEGFEPEATKSPFEE